MKWTIEELQLANDCCLPTDFIKLFKQHSPIEDKLYLYAHESFFACCDNDFLSYIANTSRASCEKDKLWETWDKMIQDLLHQK